MTIQTPDKCLTCNHTIIQLENVHQGLCQFQLESVIRCDCSGYRVGCVCAEMYCENNRALESLGESFVDGYEDGLEEK